MKSFSFSLALLLGMSCYAYGQTCPVNSVPATWDWRGSGDYTFYLYGSRYNPVGGVVRKKSPWFDTNTNENVATFRDQNPKDYESSGGWVLVQQDFGAPGRFINHPYFILYNKYTGILRIFVAISETVAGYNQAAISLKYADDTRRTAVLGFYSDEDYIYPTKTFDNSVGEITVGNTYAYDLPYWLHADFVMNYDPCTCNVSNPSLQFTVRLISESTLTFKAEGNLTPKDNLGRKSDGKLGFTDISGSVTKVVKSANDNYTNAEKAVKNLQSIFGGSTTEKNKPWELLNFVPGLGYALGLVDGLVGVFDKSKPNATKPTAYKMDFEANGTFNTVSNQRVVRWNVPGSSITVVPPTTIQYKNALGVFTLIEKPTVIFRNLSSYNACPSPYVCQIYSNMLTLDNDLRYVMNPAISTSSSDFRIQASIEIEPTSNHTIASEFKPYSCFRPSIIYEYQGDYRTNSVAGLSGKVFVKVAVYHKSGNNEAVFMARYPANVRSSDISNGCHAVSLHQNTTLMNALCGSSDYRNRANQYLRTNNNSEKILADRNETKEQESTFVVYPNPSSGILNLEYNVEESDNVHIYITDLMGKRVLDIVNPQFQTSGKHLVNFDLTAERRLSPGIYLCRFRTGAEEVTRKLVLQ